MITFVTDLIMLALWLAIGTLVLIVGPNRITYACVWGVLIFQYITKLCGDYTEGR